MTASITSITDRAGRRIGLNQPLADAYTERRTPAPQPEDATIAVFSSFVVSPGEADAWARLWQGLARTASTWPGCRTFRLVRDRNDDMYVAIFSEWDSMDAYRSFIHESGAVWLQQSMGQAVMPGESRFLEVIPTESALRTDR
jgi:heme-degrading monooxygenase HmoA